MCLFRSGGSYIFPNPDVGGQGARVLNCWMSWVWVSGHIREAG